MKTLKFWQFINGSPVRLRLKPGQSLTHHTFARHDEGWSSETNVWSNTNGVLISKLCSDGTDCDGRLTRYGVYRATQLEVNPDVESATFNGNQILYPEWIELQSKQRDEYALAANY